MIRSIAERVGLVPVTTYWEASVALPLSSHAATLVGAGASRLAAQVTGTPWDLGGATAMRQHWRKRRPAHWPADSEFVFMR
jgi:hypothetical protein